MNLYLKWGKIGKCFKKSQWFIKIYEKNDLRILLKWNFYSSFTILKIISIFSLQTNANLIKILISVSRSFLFKFIQQQVMDHCNNRGKCEKRKVTRSKPVHFSQSFPLTVSYLNYIIAVGVFHYLGLALCEPYSNKQRSPFLFTLNDFSKTNCNSFVIYGINLHLKKWYFDDVL